jgi:hypothetical protein
LINKLTGQQSYGCLLDEENHPISLSSIKQQDDPNLQFSFSYHLSLDEPMNSHPTQQETILSKKYHLIPNFFFLFNTSSSHGFSLNISHENILQSPSYSYHLCRCGDVMTKQSMFLCISCGSYQCWKHFIPWNQKNNSPDLYLITLFTEYLLRNFPEASFIPTRALLFYQKWNLAETSQERENIALQCLQEDGIHCSNCRLDTPVASIDLLLFPMNYTDTSSGSIVFATPKSSLFLLTPDTKLVQIRLIDRDKYRFEDHHTATLSPNASGTSDQFDGSLMGSVYAEPSAVLSELDVTIQSDWSYLLFRAVLLSSLFEDNLPTMTGAIGQTIDLATIPSKYFRESEWEEYAIYLVENDEMNLEGEQKQQQMRDDNCDLMIGGWKWVTHLVIDHSKITNGTNASHIRPTRRGSKTTSTAPTGHLLVHELSTDDTLTIRSNRDNVGPPSRLSLLFVQYSGNTHLQDKTKELNLFYSGWRPIRGDGNCYFRAVVFGFIENIISNTFEGMTSCTSLHVNSYELKSLAQQRRRYSFGHLVDLLTRVGHCYHYEHEQDAHHRLLWAVTQARDGEKWISVTEFENDILNSYTRLDQSLIRAIRYAAGSYILDHQEENLHGITLKEAILPSYPTCRSLEEYCEEYVLRMGIDAEGPLVDMGILFSLLHSKGTLVMFDRRYSTDRISFFSSLFFSHELSHFIVVIGMRLS